MTLELGCALSIEARSNRDESVRAPRSLRGLGVRSERAAAVGAVLAATLAAAGAAQAADADHDLVVTGQKADHNVYADPVAPYKIDRLSTTKLTEPLINIPKSITVIPKEVIRDTGATTFRDLMRTQPGVTLGTGEGGNAFGDRFFVRGFDTRNDIFVDGVRDPGVGSREVFAVEQVEVLKGPSSTFGGRGTTGAAISLISKQPAESNFAIATATGGTDDTKRGTLDVNRVINDQLTVRINAMVHRSDVAGRDYVFNNRWGVAASLAYQPSDKLRVGLDYYHLTTDEMPDWGFPYDIANNRPFQVRRENFYGVLDRDYRSTRADIGTAKFEYSPTEMVSLHSTFRYGNTLNAYIASAPEAPNTVDPDPANWTLRANPKQRDATTNTWANLSDITWRFGPEKAAHTLVTGVEFSRERVRNNQYLAYNSELGGGVVVAPATIIQNLQHPDPTQHWPGGYNLSAVRTTQVDTKSVYGLDTLKLGEHWEILGGLRFDSYSISLTNVVLPANTATTLTNERNFLNYHVGLAYKPVENGTIYFAYGTSSNPSGEQLDAAAADYGGLAANTAALDAERNRAYEAGIKWNVAGGHLNLTAAAFRIEKVNARVTVGSGATAVVDQSGDQRVDGLEFGVSGNLTQRLSLFGGLTLLNGRVINSPIVAQNGQVLPNIARTSFTMMGRYQVTDRLYLGGQANFNSRKFGGTFSATTTSVPAYWRFDLFGGYKLTDHADLSINLLNVSDKLYYDALYRSAMPFTYLAPGRSAQVKLSYAF